MSLYNRYCDRCGRRTTHGEVGNYEDPDEYKSVQEDNNRTLYCRQCEDSGYLSKGDIEEDETIVAEVAVGDVLEFNVHPDFIAEDDSLEEHVEKEVKENCLGRLAAAMADGIREGQVEVKRVKREE